ncbi:hypothetical protein GCM10027564_24120 [Luteimonas notoginsengisoli]
MRPRRIAGGCDGIGNGVGFGAHRVELNGGAGNGGCPDSEPSRGATGRALDGALVERSLWHVIGAAWNGN